LALQEVAEVEDDLRAIWMGPGEELIVPCLEPAFDDTPPDDGMPDFDFDHGEPTIIEPDGMVLPEVAQCQQDKRSTIRVALKCGATRLPLRLCEVPPEFKAKVSLKSATWKEALATSSDESGVANDHPGLAEAASVAEGEDTSSTTTRLQRECIGQGKEQDSKSARASTGSHGKEPEGEKGNCFTTPPGSPELPSLIPRPALLKPLALEQPHLDQDARSKERGKKKKQVKAGFGVAGFVKFIQKMVSCTSIPFFCPCSLV